MRARVTHRPMRASLLTAPPSCKWFLGFDAFVMTLLVLVGQIAAGPFLSPMAATAMAVGYLYKEKLTTASFTAVVACASAVVEVGYTAGAVLGFALGRSVLSECAGRIARQHRVLQALDTALGSERGLYINVLLRLSPIIPYNVLQYALACTSTTFCNYTLGCVIGQVPYAVVFCALGAVLGDLTASGLAKGKCAVRARGAVLASHLWFPSSLSRSLPLHRRRPAEPAHPWNVGRRVIGDGRARLANRRRDAARDTPHHC